MLKKKVPKKKRRFGVAMQPGLFQRPTKSDGSGPASDVRKVAPPTTAALASALSALLSPPAPEREPEPIEGWRGAT